MAAIAINIGSAGLDAPDRVRPRPRTTTCDIPWFWRQQEWLLGRPTFDIARCLERSQWWPPDRLRALQLTRLRRIVDHARTRCPYYRDAGLPSGESLRERRDVARLPLLSRDELRRHARRMCWRHMPARRLYEFTSGTSDESIRYYWDRRRQAWDKANRIRAQRWHGQSIGDRDLHVWPFDPPRTWAARLKQRLRDERDALFDLHQIDSLRATGHRLGQSWRTWRRIDPLRVTAYPSVLARMILEGQQRGWPMGTPSLRRVYLTGEVTFPWQRSLIETHLAAPTSQDYGLQELGALAFSCEHGTWHVSAESALVEILRHGRPARPGELGEVVVTALESLAMPMIRYCTGDIVRAEQEARCPCGRALPAMPPILGRASDFLEAADGRWIEPGQVVSALGRVVPQGSFQIVQAGDAGVVVSVVGRSAVDSARRAAITASLGGLLGEDVSVRIESADRLRRTRFGKCRYVVSKRTAGGLALPDDR